MDRNSEEFVTLLTANQSALYACILALLPNRAAAQDILQETNLTLWRKADDFEPGTHFLAWATRVARYHILNHRRTARRDQLVFDDALFEDLAIRQADRVAEFDHREDALSFCLGKLSSEQRELIAERYEAGGSVQNIATKTGRSVGAVSQTLYRIREMLLDCIQAHLVTCP